MTPPSSSGDPQIQIMIQDAHAIVARLEQEGARAEECRKWIEKIDATFRRRILGFLLYSAYDVIWQAFNRIRHCFCQIAPISDLLSIALNIQSSLTYIVREDDRKQYESELGKIKEALRLHVAGHDPTGPCAALPLEHIRYELERLSRLVADARDAHWRKVNLLRMRLLVTAIIVGGLLIVSLWLVPSFIKMPDFTWTHVLTVISFGSLGGLVSAIRTMESLEVSTSAYYIQRTLLGLRPVIGAAAGLMLYLIQISGLLSIVPAGANPSAAYLVLAFVAGFSERFFVAQIGRITGTEKKGEKDTREKTQAKGKEIGVVVRDRQD